MWKNLGHVSYHFLIVAVSAALALSIPRAAGFLVKSYLQSWGQLANSKAFLISVEIGIAAALILIVNDLRRTWKDRRLAGAARAAGLSLLNPGKGLLARRSAARMKCEQGRAREVMIIGATGFRTFVDAAGDLHEAVKNCREARIMLLDPRGEGARSRALSLPIPEVTPGRFREQIRASIDYLKGLRLLQKDVRLKLYPDTPLLKLAVLGDDVWVRHYHPGVDVSNLPEFVFSLGATPGGLYSPLRQYFLSRWEDPRMPEYDLETDELIYQDEAGGVRRETFAPAEDREPALVA